MKIGTGTHPDLPHPPQPLPKGRGFSFNGGIWGLENHSYQIEKSDKYRYNDCLCKIQPDQLTCDTEY
jgi:hypothetical protein